TTIATIPIFAQIVPLSQPSASSEKWILRGRGAGGSWIFGARSSVIGHQIRKITTMTVVICTIRSALPLDSWIPLMLLHQKYTVTAIANSAAKTSSGLAPIACAAATQGPGKVV